MNDDTIFDTIPMEGGTYVLSQLGITVPTESALTRPILKAYITTCGHIPLACKLAHQWQNQDKQVERMPARLQRCIERPYESPPRVVTYVTGGRRSTSTAATHLLAGLSVSTPNGIRKKVLTKPTTTARTSL